ncbi:Arm DNA-binding domain-containing protein [Rickettsia sp. TH2014]|uniref:Arm DNA-binding domain-containing protein n=1 Tax=Rickettsia sp. TH2014 TaxID=1967503 RepID=UPI002115C528|nr:Arm DNA-binding domain-containing protein [Rickettsia sp. TH2014]
MRKQPLCFNFTKNNLLKIEPAREKRALYKDTKEKGLVLIVSYGGSKTFYLAQMVKDEYKRVKLGRFPDLPVEEARLKAAKLKYKIAMVNIPLIKHILQLKMLRKISRRP